jgi:hypothetical protein
MVATAELVAEGAENTNIPEVGPRRQAGRRLTICLPLRPGGGYNGGAAGRVGWTLSDRSWSEPRDLSLGELPTS